MVAFSAIAPYLVEYGPLVLQYLMSNQESLSYIGGEVRDLYRAVMDTSPNERRQVLRENSYRLYDILKGATKLGFVTAVSVYNGIQMKAKAAEYRQYEANTSSSHRAQALAALIFLSILSLSYFTLVPQKTTIHTIIPMTTNIPGLVLSFILLCISVVVVLKKD